MISYEVEILRFSDKGESQLMSFDSLPEVNEFIGSFDLVTKGADTYGFNVRKITNSSKLICSVRADNYNNHY